MTKKTTVHQATCRQCMNSCALTVTVDDRPGGRVVTHVAGDRDSPLFEGYSCVKGRIQPALLRSTDRLLRPLKRMPSGVHEPIPMDQALDEIAATLARIADTHGPGAIASYWGMMSNASPTSKALLDAFMDALGSHLRFTPVTVDKPGKLTARALHGSWMAPVQGFDEPEVVLVLGMNPLVAHQGFPVGNPGRWLADRRRRGMKLVVVDPRRSDLAKRADVFIQNRPGSDSAILAALLHVILAEDLHDHEFVERHVEGVDALRSAVAPFAPAAVATIADVDAADLVAAARLFAAAGRGYAIAGTGAHMSGSSTLVEYLTLALDTLCGHWLREGEIVRNPGTMATPFSAKAQVRPPSAALTGQVLPASGLPISVAGPPIAGLPDEITDPAVGSPGVRALLSVGGNPVSAWPDETRVSAALEQLDLLVQIDPWMSQTARHAHYVLPPKMPLEVPSYTHGLEAQAAYGAGYGCADSYAQWSPTVADPPPGADVLEEWEMFYELARRLGRPLDAKVSVWGVPLGTVTLDMDHRPTSEDLITELVAGSRVPLAELRRHPHGAFFPDPVVRVAAADPGSAARMDVGNASVLIGLRDGLVDHAAPRGAGTARPFRLICRRLPHVYNSSGNVTEANRGRPYNAAFMHPDDLAALGVSAGEAVRVRSHHGEIVSPAQPDRDLRRGTVSLAHGFGGDPGREDTFRTGSNVNRLLGRGFGVERFTGQLAMSNIPVAVEASRSG